MGTVSGHKFANSVVGGLSLKRKTVNVYGFANPAAGPLHKIVNGIARSAGQQNNNNGKSSAGWDEGKEADIVGEV